MNKKILNILICSTTLLWAFSLHAADKDTLLKELKRHKARSASTWSEFTGKRIKERILPAPDIIVDYLRKDNELNDYKERPYKAKVDSSFLEDIYVAIGDLPEIVKKQIENHVVAVFLVQELGTTGYGELLRDFDENRLGFIVLDVDFLNKRANDWISWRENSPFRDTDGYMIRAEIEQKNNDCRMAAIQYILLHEVGHIVGVAKGSHPNWLTGGNPQKWPFAKLSWLKQELGFAVNSKYDQTFTNRNKLKFYAFQNASLTSEDIDETYDQLLKTDFVSLYAATNIYDDFAEAYAMYVHVVLQNRPWKIRIIQEGKIVREITNPILDKRCETKKKYLDKFFK